MRKIWKICYMVLALLPLLPIIVYALGNVGSDAGVLFEPFPALSVAQDGTITADGADGSGMYSMYIDTFGAQISPEGLQRAVGRMLYWVQDNCGYVITVPFVMAVWYMLYVGFVGILLALMAVVFFVPNAIERWMRAW